MEYGCQNSPIFSRDEFIRDCFVNVYGSLFKPGITHCNGFPWNSREKVNFHAVGAERLLYRIRIRAKTPKPTA